VFQASFDIFTSTNVFFNLDLFDAKGQDGMEDCNSRVKIENCIRMESFIRYRCNNRPSNSTYAAADDM
jgi:hypothetical protein